jgi:glycosyltransferase involved in cell wall biosynthesis
MRVIHVLQGLHAAGIEHLALQLIAHSPAGTQGVLLNLDPEAQALRQAFQRCCERGQLETILDRKGRDGLGLAMTCWRVFRRQRPQALVLYAFSRPMLWVALAARLAGVSQMRAHIGNAAPVEPAARRRWLQLLRWFQRLGVVALPCSEAVDRSFAPLPNGLRLGPVVPNGCDVEDVAMRSAAVRNQRGPSAPVVLMVARLDVIKDQPTLLRAFAQSRQPGWQLQLVGDGPRRGELEQLIDELDLTDVVNVLGRRDDVPEHLGSADLFAFSTTAAEGFGIALVEAMAAGLPVIASDVPACREVLADGAAGLLVPAGNVQAWTSALQELMAQPKTRQHLAEAAAERARTYGIEACANRWYQELMQ